MKWRDLIAAALFVVNAAAAADSSPRLLEGPRVGDPAPPLVNALWLKGKPVPSWRPGNVYILDIWAPWCGPCLGGMQHLTDLQRSYAARGLQVVGLTGTDDYGSTLAAARKVIARKRGAIAYSMAWDENHRLYDIWMAREKNEGWPWAFVIGRDGRIAFIGHPEKLDAVLGSILAGTYDMDAATRRYRSRCDALDYATQFATARKSERWHEADALYRRLFDTDREVAGPYVTSEYRILAVNLRDADGAARFGREVLTAYSDSGSVLLALASTIVDPDVSLVVPDYELATLSAERADQLAGRHQAAAAATLAKVYFAAGRRAAAINTQRRAVALSDESNRKAAADVLSKYLAAPNGH